MRAMTAALAVAAAVGLSGCSGDGGDQAPTSQADVTVDERGDATPTASASEVGVSPYGESRASSTGATVTVEKPRRVALKDDAVDRSQDYAEVRITLHNSGSSPFPSSEVSFRGACAGRPASSPVADVGESGERYGPVNRYLQPGREVHFRLVYTCAKPESLSVSASIAEGTFATFASSDG